MTWDLLVTGARLATMASGRGIDEPGAWRNSAWTGNGLARIDRVEKKNCIDCHMERVTASADELGAKRGTVASHRFVGGHTWMAAMRVSGSCEAESAKYCDPGGGAYCGGVEGGG